ncbi:MAG: aldehyde ferredoxin oxidoreductase family protein [Deltaproteobacteria bacterium]|nr:aldehyde ferredoxin oxidoreductase family protein [Deltaproteobacteria bacterium]
MIRNLDEQKVLYVDLSAGRTWVEDVPPQEVVKFLGGRGLAAKILAQRIKPGIDPLGPDNVLIFGTGTLTGTNAPSSGRMTITAKGPATGLYLKTSVGGHLGAELKYAGYDYIVFLGAAEKPVYLWIDDGQVEIREAGRLWGQGTRQTDTLIKEELGDEDIQTAVIGPAGENKVLIACILFSRFNSASRGGIGAVMGSKNLKAVAVRGSGGLRPAQGKEFFDLASRLRHELAQDTVSGAFFQWGTIGFVPGLNEMGYLASNNFSQCGIEGAVTIGGQYLEDEGYLTGRESCFGCSTACHRFVETKDHTYGQVKDSGPELEAALALAAECGHVDTEALLLANHLCNDYGIDVISTGHIISWAMECYEKGLLKEDQADGLDLHFGNVAAELELIKRIARREGPLGDMLAQGTRRAAEKVGGDSWKLAIQAKGLEQSAVDTRSAKGYALAFALNPRGPDHLTSEVIAEYGLSDEARALIKKITGDEKYANPTLVDKRVEIVTWHEDCFAATDALGYCAFTSTAAYAITPANMAQLFGHGVGVEMSEAELMEAGRRIVTLERCFNIAQGSGRQDDILPWRMMNEEIPNGPQKGLVTDKKMLDGMLDDYYKQVGWDPQTGRPTSQTVKRLGLAELCGESPGTQ